MAMVLKRSTPRSSSILWEVRFQDACFSISSCRISGYFVAIRIKDFAAPVG